MTAEQLALLTDEEKRIRIAEFMGFERAHTARGFYMLDLADDGVLGLYHPEAGGVVPAPDYCESLDAIAQAEARLTDEQHRNFRDALRLSFFDPSNAWADNADRKLISATARQRADAILIIL